MNLLEEKNAGLWGKKHASHIEECVKQKNRTEYCQLFVGSVLLSDGFLGIVRIKYLKAFSYFAPKAYFPGFPVFPARKDVFSAF